VSGLLLLERVRIWAEGIEVITTRKLTKQYGDLIAVNNIDLDLAEGDVFGFIGPNGSGKTTTMRMIATLLNPTHGEAYVCGKSIYTNPAEIRRLVGYMPDFFGVYDDMTVIEYLEFFAATYRIDAHARRGICEDKLELVDMSFKRDAMVNQLSRGQTQRIGLARVLLHEPQVLLLDEPASGLDPRARIEIRTLLKRLGELKKTVVVSSHILPELADVCTRVGMIEKGHLIVDGNVEEVMRKAREWLVLHVKVKAGRGSGEWSGETDAAATDRAAGLIEQSDLVESVTIDSGTILATLVNDVMDYTELPTILIERGFRIEMFREEDVNLETAFMHLTKGLVQ
jgi:ABC-2 type transport system ATP-binding protein